MIALRLAARHPDLVESLVVADSSAGSGTDPAKAEGMRARAAELAELGPRAFAEKRGPRLVSGGAPEELVQRVVDTMAGSVRLPGYAYAAESMASTPTCGPNCPGSPRPRSSCAATRTRSPVSRPRRSS